MVARNFPVHDKAYSKLLQDDNRSVLIEELKPSGYQNIPPQHAYQPTYYELPNIVQIQCSSSSSNFQQYPSLDTSPEINKIVKANQQNCYRRNQEPPQCSKPKRKTFVAYNDIQEGNVGDKCFKTIDENKKQNHSEIEKRRRDKMNEYMLELSSMVPMCRALSRKLDKLTVLRMAVQHLKSIKSSVDSYSEGHYKPPFLSDQALQKLILQASDGFLFVVGCDRGQILFVSESVINFLNVARDDLIGQSLFDILHPKDVSKVKDQLSSSDLMPREKLIDAKTMLPVKPDVHQDVSRFCTGARRSFFCRMKRNAYDHVKAEAETTTGCHRRKNKPTSDKKFIVVHCTGYLKAWVPGLEDEYESDGYNLSCLVAVGRILPNISGIASAKIQSTFNMKPIQFVSRHALDGKFLFVDQRTTLVLGYLPQELLGTSMYEYYHHDDIHIIADCHKTALQSSTWVTTKIYRFKTKDGGYIKLQSEWKSFKNPWTKEMEHLISKNNLIWMDYQLADSSACKTKRIAPEFAFIGADKEMQRMINNHVEASNVGRLIAEQVINIPKKDNSCRNINLNLDLASVANTETYISTSCLTSQSIDQIQENNSIIYKNDLKIRPESISDISNNDGNDEVAMAVLMSLLETDASLEEHVDFSWPLLQVE